MPSGHTEAAYKVAIEKTMHGGFGTGVTSSDQEGERRLFIHTKDFNDAEDMHRVLERLDDPNEYSTGQSLLRGGGLFPSWAFSKEQS